MSIQNDGEFEPLTTRIQSVHALRNESVYFPIDFHPVFGFVTEQQSMVPAVKTVFGAVGIRIVMSGLRFGDGGGFTCGMKYSWIVIDKQIAVDLITNLPGKAHDFERHLGLLKRLMGCSYRVSPSGIRIGDVS